MKRFLFSTPLLPATENSSALFVQHGLLLKPNMLLNSKTILESLKYYWNFQNSIRNSKIVLESLKGCWNV
jgi:hypothetical protein